LALQVNIREDRLSEIVCGATTPRADERTAICSALGIDDTEALWAAERYEGLAVIQSPVAG
jgi:hypothetical protein